MSELCVATWNCFGMGQGAWDAVTMVRAPYRARLKHPDVARAFEGAHVTCVQEILSRDAEAFFDALPGALVRDTNHMELVPVTMRGSGLGLATHVPRSEATTQRFPGRQVGWDRLARKGTMHVRLDVGGVEVDLLNVHLQAGYDASCVSVRGGQIDEVGRRIEALGHEDRPFVVCGDFNVCGLAGGCDEYPRLRRALLGFDDLGAVDDLATFDPHHERNALAHATEPGGPCQRVDYIFVRAGRKGSIRVRDVRRILDQPLASCEGSAAFASDHFGLSARFDVA